MFPVHVNDNHWCLLTSFLKEHKIIYLDSQSEKEFNANKQAMNYLAEFSQNLLQIQSPQEFNKWEYIYAQVPQQFNNSDCGVYSCLFGFHICYGIPLQFTTKDITIVRSKICKDLISGSVSNLTYLLYGKTIEFANNSSRSSSIFFPQILINSTKNSKLQSLSLSVSLPLPSFSSSSLSLSSSSLTLAPSSSLSSSSSSSSSSLTLAPSSSSSLTLAPSSSLLSSSSSLTLAPSSSLSSSSSSLTLAPSSSSSLFSTPQDLKWTSNQKRCVQKLTVIR